MKARGWTLVAAAGLTAALLSSVGGASMADAALVTGTLTGSPAIQVAGSSWFYPAFDPTISRYAVHPADDGTVRVEVADAQAVWFDGALDSDGAATFSGLEPGDEISVFIDDGSGRRAYALYVLPAAFPRLIATRSGAPLAPGNIAVTLDRYDGNRSPRYEAVLDRFGVPVHSLEHRQRELDLKMSRSGQWTVHRPTTTPGRSGGALVVLDDQFRETRRIETTGLSSTDDHDSVLESDGSRWLTAYEPNPETDLVDSIIQHVTADGTVDFQWSSADFAEETVADGDADYAHINSIDVQPNGDVLASFRHLSSVFLIASRPHDGHRSGDVIWKLGGRDSTFAFPPGDGGTCAQHSASLLPNGNVLVFDNGSTSYFGSYCLDPADPTGPTTQRPTTRVVEFALTADSAAPVRTYGPADRFSWFMGSAARLSNNNVLIGWSADQRTMASETDPTGSTIWTLDDERLRQGGDRPNAFISYRAALVPERDGVDPDITLAGPSDGATVSLGADVTVSFTCRDRGGSTLQSCDGPPGQRLDTASVGIRSWQVTARDGAGRRTTTTRSYTVANDPTAPPSTPSPAVPVSAPIAAPTPALTPPAAGARPDLAVRIARGTWVGAGAYAPDPQTSILDAGHRRTGRVLLIRVANTGAAAGRFWLRAPSRLGGGEVRITYSSGGRDRTRMISQGWRTPVLDPGENLRLRVRVQHTEPGTPPDVWTLPVRATSSSARVRSRDRVTVTIQG